MYLQLDFERLLNHGIDYGNIADQFLWNSVAISQVGHTGRTHPDLIIHTLPDKDFKGQIKCKSGDAIMSGVPPFGLPKISTWASCIVRPTRLASPL